MNQVGLTEQADKLSKFLSGGMRRRLSMGTVRPFAAPTPPGDNVLPATRSHRVGTVATRRAAMALIGDPKIVILDEPTTGLDPLTRRQIWEILQQLKRGRSTILTTVGTRPTPAAARRAAHAPRNAHPPPVGGRPDPGLGLPTCGSLQHSMEEADYLCTRIGTRSTTRPAPDLASAPPGPPHTHRRRELARVPVRRNRQGSCPAAGSAASAPKNA